MAKYTVSHSCGHDVTHELFGKHKERDRRIAWLEGQDCSECRKLAFNAANAANAANVADSDLPELRGSEKQINWARTIRVTKAAEIRAIVAKTVARYTALGQPGNAAIAERAGHRILDNADSRYWIDNRTYSALGLLQDVMVELAKQGVATIAEIDAVMDAVCDVADGGAL